jgi:hypothetical protein
MKVQGAEANQLKRKAYDTFELAIEELDLLSAQKDANGAKIKLKKLQINQKCSTLLTLAKMSKDMDIISTPSTKTDEDNEYSNKLDAKL